MRHTIIAICVIILISGCSKDMEFINHDADFVYNGNVYEAMILMSSDGHGLMKNKTTGGLDRLDNEMTTALMMYTFKKIDELEKGE